MVASKIDDFLKHPHPHSVTREIFRYIFKQQPYIHKYLNYSLIPDEMMKLYESIIFKDIKQESVIIKFIIYLIPVHRSLEAILRRFFHIFTYVEKKDPDQIEYKFTVQFGSYFVEYTGFKLKFEFIYKAIIGQESLIHPLGTSIPTKFDITFPLNLSELIDSFKMSSYYGEIEYETEENFISMLALSLKPDTEQAVQELVKEKQKKSEAPVAAGSGNASAGISERDSGGDEEVGSAAGGARGGGRKKTKQKKKKYRFRRNYTKKISKNRQIVLKGGASSEEKTKQLSEIFEKIINIQRRLQLPITKIYDLYSLFYKPSELVVLPGGEQEAAEPEQQVLLRGNPLPAYLVDKEGENHFLYMMDTYDFGTFTPFLKYTVATLGPFFILGKAAENLILCATQAKIKIPNDQKELLISIGTQTYMIYYREKINGFYAKPVLHQKYVSTCFLLDGLKTRAFLYARKPIGTDVQGYKTLQIKACLNGNHHHCRLVKINLEEYIPFQDSKINYFNESANGVELKIPENQTEPTFSVKVEQAFVEVSNKIEIYTRRHPNIFQAEEQFPIYNKIMPIISSGELRELITSVVTEGGGGKKIQKGGSQAGNAEYNKADHTKFSVLENYYFPYDCDEQKYYNIFVITMVYLNKNPINQQERQNLQKEFKLVNETILNYILSKLEDKKVDSTTRQVLSGVYLAMKKKRKQYE